MAAGVDNKSRIKVSYDLILAKEEVPRNLHEREIYSVKIPYEALIVRDDHPVRLMRHIRSSPNLEDKSNNGLEEIAQVSIVGRHVFRTSDGISTILDYYVNKITNPSAVVTFKRKIMDDEGNQNDMG